MRKIGLTQRVETVDAYHETRDALDQRWTDLLHENHLLAVPIPNRIDVSEFIRTLALDGLILTGGNDHEYRTLCEQACLRYALQQHLPILGVCHGMQTIARYFKVPLHPIDGHVATTHVISVKPNPYSIPVDTYIVNSYHRFTLESIPQNFECLATDNDGHCEAFYHREWPIVAFMWHPERTPALPWFNFFIQSFFNHDAKLQMYANFCPLCRRR